MRIYRNIVTIVCHFTSPFKKQYTSFVRENQGLIFQQKGDRYLLNKEQSSSLLFTTENAKEKIEELKRQSGQSGDKQDFAATAKEIDLPQRVFNGEKLKLADDRREDEIDGLSISPIELAHSVLPTARSQNDLQGNVLSINPSGVDASNNFE
ncbi:MAG: hypothetical protein KKE55_07005, partial [Candidatus Omnitrophica bacterium]|nr:hypothetical protein [Candidatus Omnitrophota bacterium]